MWGESWQQTDSHNWLLSFFFLSAGASSKKTTRGVPKRGAAAQGLRRRSRAEVKDDRGDGPSHVNGIPLNYDLQHSRYPERLPVRGGCVFHGVASPTGGGRESLGLGGMRAGRCPSPVTKETRARVASPHLVEDRRHGRGGWGGGGAPGRRHLTAHPSSAGSGTAASGRLAAGQPTGRNERGRRRGGEGRGAASDRKRLTHTSAH